MTDKREETASATARPWRIGGSIGDYILIESNDRTIIAKMPQTQNPSYAVLKEENSNAELIVRAVNSHDALIFHIEDLLEQIAQFKDRIAINTSHAENALKIAKGK